MAKTAPTYGGKQEFWKPAIGTVPESGQVAVLEKTCAECGVGLIAGSRFCHACGAATSAPDAAAPSVPPWFSLAAMGDFLGVSTISLICLFLGAVCIIAAIVTGFIYTASTLADWQAVQVWRIEWLLAATTLFVAGILLKKK